MLNCEKISHTVPSTYEGFFFEITTKHVLIICHFAVKKKNIFFSALVFLILS